MSTVCVYHSADLDGICSAAIVRRVFSNENEIEFIGWNYGQPIPLEKLIGNDVIMVDLCFQPFDEMIKLKSVTADLIWIDHHKTSVEEALKNKKFKYSGLVSPDKAACELVWEYFMGSTPVPKAVTLLGMYDSWRFVKESEEYQEYVLNFQYGMRALALQPDSPQWRTLFTVVGAGSDYVSDIVRNGETILAYEKIQNEKTVKSLSFEAEFDGYKAICINKGPCNSKLFASVWDPEKYDLMIPFVYKRGQYAVSLYSTKEEVDCSAIAKKYGGGGHKGASGFQIDCSGLFKLLKVNCAD